MALVNEFQRAEKDYYRSMVQQCLMHPSPVGIKNCDRYDWGAIAAENAAFMFSVTESCSLNGINPESYLEDVFWSILFGTNRDRRDFLPCYYQWQEMPKMTGLEVAKLLSTAV